MSTRLQPTWLHHDRPRHRGSLDAVVSPGGRLVDASAAGGEVVLEPAEVEQSVGRVAAALRAAGAGRGDTVAWQAANRWEVVVLYRACWRLGAVAAPIHHLAGPAEVDALLATLDPAVVVDVESVAAWAQAAGPTVGPGEVDVGGDDLAVVLHTSGSTGTPKGVLHTHASLGHKAELMVGVHELVPDDVILMPAPLAHVSGLQNAVTVAAAARMGVVLLARWDPEVALDLIERHRVTFMIGPPTFFVSLRGTEGFSPDRVAGIRLISCGGAGVTPAFAAETAAAFGCTVKRTYGSTEAPTVTTSHAGDDPVRAGATDGRPTGAVHLRLGPSDELWVRGPELFVGYTDPDRTAEAVVRDDVGHPWFRTGDIGRIEVDDLGHHWLTIVGRIKDVIIRGGENIAAAEVESVLEAHPSVAHAVVVGRPHDRLGEQVCAFVVCSPGSEFDLDAARAWFAEQGVARFKTPEVVEVLDELPTLAAGKPDRPALARRAAALG